jgi:hypothetical protein
VLRLRWEQGERPDVRQFLADAGSLSVPQLVAVLLLDQRQRWLIGERVQAETYLSWYPVLQVDLEGTAELIYGEYLLREELGEAPALEEYTARFPPCAERLRLQIEFHQALASDVFDSGQTDPDRTRIVSHSSEEHPTGAPHQPSLLTSTWPTVPGYEILGELGRGGMGVVYKAWQTSLKRVVALKMIRNDQLAGVEELTRFRVEAEAVGRLQHPNVVHVYDVEAQDGRPFFSMEYVDGGSLAQKLDGTPWPSRPAAELIETLARAMHHAHRQGVVHRDLKPANVLLQKSEVRGQRSEEGQARQLASDVCPLISDLRPKITDFGLAKLLVGGRTSTIQSGVLGTPSYMSPSKQPARVRKSDQLPTFIH